MMLYGREESNISGSGNSLVGQCFVGFGLLLTLKYTATLFFKLLLMNSLKNLILIYSPSTEKSLLLAQHHIVVLSVSFYFYCFILLIFIVIVLSIFFSSCVQSHTTYGF